MCRAAYVTSKTPPVIIFKMRGFRALFSRNLMQATDQPDYMSVLILSASIIFPSTATFACQNIL